MGLAAITFLLAVIIDLVYGQCDWTVMDAVQIIFWRVLTALQTEITDIRTPTPVAFTLTATGVSNCAAFPTVVVGYYTAVWNGVTYTEQSPETEIFNTASVVYGAVTFPGLIATNLVPGSSIDVVIALIYQVKLTTQFWTDHYLPNTFISTGHFR